MGHRFGGAEPSLRGPRNGLSIHQRIVEAFEECWITIVPFSSDSINSAPTEWKVILLRQEIADNVFLTDQWGDSTVDKIWKWRDIDGRKLSFPNANRPAPRFFYLRYILAYLHAVEKWPGFEERVPPGSVWARQETGDGYVRREVLMGLDRRIRDKLPAELIKAGGFEDPEEEGRIWRVYDELAGLVVSEKIRAHLGGERDPKKDDDR